MIKTPGAALPNETNDTVQKRQSPLARAFDNYRQACESGNQLWIMRAMNHLQAVAQQARSTPRAEL